MRLRRSAPWIACGVFTLAAAAYLAHRWQGEDATAFLPGRTSHGHYQIELRCDACHTPWMGVKEESCHRCHAEELKMANDAHPKSKFTDPRNADRLLLIDAANCVTCHREHVPEQTRAMGVTMPADYCCHCHQQTLKDRPSHASFPFDSCATAGCHNYHDNRALYEDFLLKHLHEPDHKKPAVLPARLAVEAKAEKAHRAAAQDAPQGKATAEVVAEWEADAHARAGVNCSGCHSAGSGWSDTVSHKICAECHPTEHEGFLAGKHGMRLARELAPMRPGLARLPMKAEAARLELGCVSCHGSESAHRFGTQSAAVEACLKCHDDEHSRAYQASPHFELWSEERAGRGAAGTGVSCATCHLPREMRKVDGQERMVVEHNQNHNLRPNEKMAREVCLNCHGLGMTLNALADAALVKKNFRGNPTVSLETLGLAEKRARERNKK